MTIAGALAALARSRPGMLTSPEAVSVLSALDSVVYNRIYKRHLPLPEYSFEGYDDNSPGDTVLLIPDEYSDVYLFYLDARADLESGENERYNCSAELFNSKWDEFVKFYASGHHPVGERSWKL